jgi:hypothetical protein
MAVVKDIKERLCFVAPDFDKAIEEFSKSSEGDRSYTLPDKEILKVKGTVLCQVPEYIFKPSLADKECASL